MQQLLTILANQRTRAWLYRVLLAVVPLLLAYGVLDERTLALWLGLGGAVLGIGTAAYNTTTRPMRINFTNLETPSGVEVKIGRADAAAIHAALVNLKRQRGQGLGLD